MSDLSIGHHLAQHTFFPMLIMVLGIMVSSPFAWWFGYATFAQALALPWIGLLIACVWIMLLGDYVIPRETYNYRRE